jgi:hypothetical protein
MMVNKFKRLLPIKPTMMAQRSGQLVAIPICRHLCILKIFWRHDDQPALLVQLIPAFQSLPDDTLNFLAHALAFGTTEDVERPKILVNLFEKRNIGKEWIETCQQTPLLEQDDQVPKSIRPFIRALLLMAGNHPMVSSDGAGGMNRSKTAAVLAPDTPDHPLQNTQDVSVLLGDSINRLRRGELDPRVANAMGYLACVGLRSSTGRRFSIRIIRCRGMRKSINKRELAVATMMSVIQMFQQLASPFFFEYTPLPCEI